MTLTDFNCKSYCIDHTIYYIVLSLKHIAITITCFWKRSSYSWSESGRSGNLASSFFFVACMTVCEMTSLLGWLFSHVFINEPDWLIAVLAIVNWELILCNSIRGKSSMRRSWTVATLLVVLARVYTRCTCICVHRGRRLINCVTVRACAKSACN